MQWVSCWRCSGTFYQGKTYARAITKPQAALKGAYEAPFGLAAAKWAATVFSYWAGIPGGIFTPSLTIGAMIGEHIASFAQLGDASNVAVLLCMAAFLAAATQSPLTAAVVVMEDGRTEFAVLDAADLHLCFTSLAPILAASVLPCRRFALQTAY